MFLTVTSTVVSVVIRGFFSNTQYNTNSGVGVAVPAPRFDCGGPFTLGLAFNGVENCTGTEDGFLTVMGL
jgi:hypothetical protein